MKASDRGIVRDRGFASRATRCGSRSSTESVRALTGAVVLGYGLVCRVQEVLIFSTGISRRNRATISKAEMIVCKWYTRHLARPFRPRSLLACRW